MLITIKSNPLVSAPETWVAYGRRKEGAGEVFTLLGLAGLSFSPNQFLKMGENKVWVT